MLLKDFSLKSRLIMLLVAVLICAAVYIVTAWGDSPRKTEVHTTTQP
jgi:hypothetical protein